MRVARLVPCLLMAAAVVALAPGAGVGQKMLTFNEVVEPQSLSPINSQYDVEARFADLFFDKLIGYNEFMRPEPQLLESLDPVEVSEDKMRHTFKLRQGAMWHALRKGNQELMPATELTAEDVVFTYNIIRDDRTETDKRQVVGIFQDVVAVDKYRVQFVLTQPMSDIRNFLFFQVIPKHIFGAEVPAYLTTLDDFGTNKVVGTGPYQFAVWRQNKGIAMLRNADYYKGWPDLFEEGATHIDRMQMRIQKDENASKENLLAAGSQLLPLVNPVHYSELRNNPSVRVQNYNPRTVMFFAYNNERPPLNRIKVRQALTHAVDRKRMLDQIYGASVAQDAKINILSGPYPGQEGNPDLMPLEYDMERAKQLLDEAGCTVENGKVYFTEGGAKQPLLLNLRVAETQEDKRRICEYFQDDLRKIGVEIKMEFMPRANWRKEVAEKRQYDVTLVHYSFSPTADIVEELFAKAAMVKGRNNITMYSNPRVEQLLDANRTTDDPEMKTKNNHQLHFILWKDCPATFLFSTPNYAAYRIDRLGGVEIHPFDFFAFITNWYFLPGGDDFGF